MNNVYCDSESTPRYWKNGTYTRGSKKRIQSVFYIIDEKYYIYLKKKKKNRNVKKNNGNEMNVFCFRFRVIEHEI